MYYFNTSTGQTKKLDFKPTKTSGWVSLAMFETTKRKSKFDNSKCWPLNNLKRGE